MLIKKFSSLNLGHLCLKYPILRTQHQTHPQCQKLTHALTQGTFSTKHILHPMLLCTTLWIPNTPAFTRKKNPVPMWLFQHLLSSRPLFHRRSVKQNSPSVSNPWVYWPQGCGRTPELPRDYMKKTGLVAACSVGANATPACLNAKVAEQSRADDSVTTVRDELFQFPASEILSDHRWVSLWVASEGVFLYQVAWFFLAFSARTCNSALRHQATPPPTPPPLPRQPPSLVGNNTLGGFTAIHLHQSVDLPWGHAGVHRYVETISERENRRPQEVSYSHRAFESKCKSISQFPIFLSKLRIKWQEDTLPLIQLHPTCSVTIYVCLQAKSSITCLMAVRNIQMSTLTKSGRSNWPVMHFTKKVTTLPSTARFSKNLIY